MKFIGIFLILAFLLQSTAAATYRNHDIARSETSSPFGAGTRAKHSRSDNQAKRDLSLSYAATDIDSKQGTRVKTVTVIKNLGKKNAKLTIDPELHKNEEWANAFRDNFDSYGTIPDVPDIDDIFEFMNKKKNKEKTEAPPSKNSSEEYDVSSVAEFVAKASTSSALDEGPVEKIKGDAELLPHGNKNRPSSTKSQSLSLSELRVREPLIEVNYSTPQHSVRQYFEKYVQASPKGYDYSKPCLNGPGSNNNPYIAPAVAKKTQPQPVDTLPPQFPPAASNPPTYSVNSILPPLQPSPPPNLNAMPQLLPNLQTSQQGSYSTSQRPYLAPRLRNGLGVNRGPGNVSIYRSGPTNAFGPGVNRLNAARSRGLKY